MILKRLNLVFFPLLFISCFSHSQNGSKDRIFETYDALVGRDNTGLYNGTEFTDLFLNTDGTYRYFKGFDYSKGSITYNGQYYVNVSLKYDLLEDNLLARSDDNLSIFNINLIPEFVESFSIYSRDFVRLTDINLEISGNGYFEEAYLGNNLKLYIKHIKRKKDKAIGGAVQYKFKEDNIYMLKTAENYYIVNSVRDIRKTLPEKEEQIRQYYKTYRSLYKSNREMFMRKLVKHLDGLRKKTQS